jgi:hypothetical protein
LDQTIKVSGHVYACRVLIVPLSMISDWIFKSVFTPNETHVNQFLPLMKHILISYSVFTPNETHVNQFLPLMKHMLISIYP